MSMTADERKAWAHERLTTYLRDVEVSVFFDAVDTLALSVEELGECPDAEKDCCRPYHKGDKYTRPLGELTEVIEATATAFIRDAS